ncbi:MAG: hypothetical protein U5N86_09705 [Planctomycetota bacterium]|nr:hypothetical protein [Planctomycetota bacterium]
MAKEKANGSRRDAPPPFYVDRFAFTGFMPDGSKTPLFPPPPPEKFVLTYFPQDPSTKVLLSSNRWYATVLRDLLNRLATHTVLCGHSLYAVQFVLKGNWSQDAVNRLTKSARRIFRKYRLALIHPFIPDHSCEERDLAALLWAERDRGAPVNAPAVADKIIASVSPQRNGEMRTFPEWQDKILRLWEEKYPKKKKVVRLGFYSPSLEHEVLEKRIEAACGRKKLVPRFLRNEVPKGSAIVMLCDPFFARATQRRLNYFFRGCESVELGDLDKERE